MTRNELAKWTAEKRAKGELLLGREAVMGGNYRRFSAGQYGSTRAAIGAMLAAMRQQVMLKWMRQAHDAELAEPGDPPTSGIEGVPEW